MKIIKKKEKKKRYLRILFVEIFANRMNVWCYRERKECFTFDLNLWVRIEFDSIASPPPSLFSSSFSHMMGHTVEAWSFSEAICRESRFRRMSLPRLGCHSLNCLLVRVLKLEGEGLEESGEWFGWKEIEYTHFFSLFCEMSGNLVVKKS